MKTKVKHSQRGQKSGFFIGTRSSASILRSAKVRRSLNPRPAKPLPSKASGSKIQTETAGGSPDKQLLSQPKSLPVLRTAEKREGRPRKKHIRRKGLQTVDLKQTCVGTDSCPANQNPPKVSKALTYALKRLKIDFVNTQYATNIDPSLTGRARRSLTQVSVIKKQVLPVVPYKKRKVPTVVAQNKLSAEMKPGCEDGDHKVAVNTVCSPVRSSSLESPRKGMSNNPACSLVKSSSLNDLRQGVSSFSFMELCSQTFHHGNSRECSEMNTGQESPKTVAAGDEHSCCGMDVAQEPVNKAVADETHTGSTSSDILDSSSVSFCTRGFYGAGDQKVMQSKSEGGNPKSSQKSVRLMRMLRRLQDSSTKLMPEILPTSAKISRRFGASKPRDSSGSSRCRNSGIAPRQGRKRAAVAVNSENAIDNTITAKALKVHEGGDAAELKDIITRVDEEEQKSAELNSNSELGAGFAEKIVDRNQVEGSPTKVQEQEQNSVEQCSSSEHGTVAVGEVLDGNQVERTTSRVLKVRKKRRRKRIFTFLKKHRTHMLPQALSENTCHASAAASEECVTVKNPTDLGSDNVPDYQEHVLLKETLSVSPDTSLLTVEHNSFCSEVMEYKDSFVQSESVTVLSSSSSQMSSYSTVELIKATETAEDASENKASHQSGQNAVAFFSADLTNELAPNELAPEQNLPVIKRRRGRPRKQHLPDAGVQGATSDNRILSQKKERPKRTAALKPFYSERRRMHHRGPVVKPLLNGSPVAKRGPGRPRKKLAVLQTSVSEDVIVQNSAAYPSVEVQPTLDLSPQNAQSASVVEVAALQDNTELPQHHSDLASLPDQNIPIASSSGVGSEITSIPEGTLVKKIRRIYKRKLKRSRWSRGIMYKQPLKTANRELRAAKTNDLALESVQMSSVQERSNICPEQDSVVLTPNHEVSEDADRASDETKESFPKAKVRAKSIPRELKNLQDDDGTKKVLGRHFRHKVKSLSRKGLLLRSKAKSEDDVASSYSSDADNTDLKDWRKKKHKLSSKLYSIDTISETKMVFKKGLKSHSSSGDKVRSPALSAFSSEEAVNPFLLGMATIIPASENKLKSQQNADAVIGSNQNSSDISTESVGRVVEVMYASPENGGDDDAKSCLRPERLHIDIGDDQPPPNITEANFSTAIHSEDLSPPPLIRPEDLFSGEYYATVSSSKGSLPAIGQSSNGVLSAAAVSTFPSEVASSCNSFSPGSIIPEESEGGAISQTHHAASSSVEVLSETTLSGKRRGRPPKHLKGRGGVIGRRMGPASKTGRAPNIRAGPASSKPGRKPSDFHIVRYNLSSVHGHLAAVEPRKFALRPKTTRSPIEIIAMRQKQEEDEYDLEEATRLARRLKRQQAHVAKHSMFSSTGLPYQTTEQETKHCSVVLVDFVKKLQLDTFDYSDQCVSDGSCGSPDASNEDDANDKTKTETSSTSGVSTLEADERSTNVESDTTPDSSRQHSLVVKKHYVDLESLKGKGFVGNFVEFLENPVMRKSLWHKREESSICHSPDHHSPSHTVGLEPIQSGSFMYVTESDVLKAGEAVLNSAYIADQSESQVINLDQEASAKKLSPQAVENVNISKPVEMHTPVSLIKALPQGRLKIFPTPDKSVLAKYFCNQCDFTSNMKQTMESHVYRHIPGVAFCCGYCSAEFSAMASVLAHVKSSHAGKEAKVWISKDVCETSMYRVEEMMASVTAPGSSGMLQPKSGLPNAADIASQICEDPSVQETQPVIISLVVSGEMPVQRQERYATASVNSTRGRFVCTHCGYSTNVKEDVEQHIEDLHSDDNLYVCYLCDKASGESFSDISTHCATIHPNRPKSFKKLPNFYDRGSISGSSSPSDKAKAEDRGNIFDRMSSFFQTPAIDKCDDSHVSLHARCQKAREYQQVLEGLRIKTSAEADSTTIGDVESLSEDGDRVERNSLALEPENSASISAPSGLVTPDRNETECTGVKTSESEPSSSSPGKDSDGACVHSLEEKSTNAQGLHRDVQTAQETQDSATDNQQKAQPTEITMESQATACEDIFRKNAQEPEVDRVLAPSQNCPDVGPASSLVLQESELSKSPNLSQRCSNDAAEISVAAVSVHDRTGTESNEHDDYHLPGVNNVATDVTVASDNLQDQAQMTAVPNDSVVGGSDVDSSFSDKIGDTEVAHILDELITEVAVLLSAASTADKCVSPHGSMLSGKESADDVSQISSLGLNNTSEEEEDALNNSVSSVREMSRVAETVPEHAAEDEGQHMQTVTAAPVPESPAPDSNATTILSQKTSTEDSSLHESRVELLGTQSRKDAATSETGENREDGSLDDDGDMLVIQLDGEIGDIERTPVTSQNDEAGKLAGEPQRTESKTDASSCSSDDNGIGIKIVEVVSLHENPDFQGAMASPQKSPVKASQQPLLRSVEGSPGDESPVPAARPGLSAPSPLPARKASSPVSSLPEVDADEIAARNERMVCTYKCHKCSVHSPALPPIVEHLKQYHSDVPLFCCPYCKRFRGSFYTEEDVHQHVKEKHPANYAKHEVSLSEMGKSFVQVLAIPSGRSSGGGQIERDVYMCLKCKGHLPDLDYAFRHLQDEHKDLMKYSCPVCKAFRDSSQEAVFKHMQLEHQHATSDVHLSLAVEDNLFMKVISISTDGVYRDHKVLQESPVREGALLGKSAAVSAVSAESPLKKTSLNTAPSSVQLLANVESADVPQPSLALVSSAPHVTEMNTNAVATVPLAIDHTAVMPVTSSQFAQLGIIQVSPYLLVPAPAHIAGMPVSVESIVSPAHHSTMTIAAGPVPLQHALPIGLSTTNRPILPAPVAKPLDGQIEPAASGDANSAGINALYPRRLTVKKILDQKKKNQELSQVPLTVDNGAGAKALPTNYGHQQQGRGDGNGPAFGGRVATSSIFGSSDVGVARHEPVWNSPVPNSQSHQTLFPAADKMDGLNPSHSHLALGPSVQSASLPSPSASAASVANFSSRPVLRVPDVLNLSLSSRTVSAALSPEAGVAAGTLAGERFSPVRSHASVPAPQVSPVQQGQRPVASPKTCADMEVENPDAYKIFNLKPRVLPSMAGPGHAALISTIPTIPAVPRSSSAGLDLQHMMHPSAMGPKPMSMASSALFPQHFRLQSLPRSTLVNSSSQPGLLQTQGPLLIAAPNAMLMPATMPQAHDHSQSQAVTSMGTAPAAHQQKPSTTLQQLALPLGTSQAPSLPQHLLFPQQSGVRQNLASALSHSSSAPASSPSPRTYQPRSGYGASRGRPRLHPAQQPSSLPLRHPVQRPPVLPSPQQQQQRQSPASLTPSPPRAQQRQSACQQYLCPYCLHQEVLKPWEVSQHIHVHHTGKPVVYKRLDKSTSK